MVARHKNGPSPFHNRCSNDTTSRTSGSTESKMQGSYNWWGSNPPFPEVDMTAIRQIGRLEESNTNKLQQCIRALEAQIIECNKSKYGEISTYGKRVNILCWCRI